MDSLIRQTIERSENYYHVTGDKENCPACNTERKIESILERMDSADIDELLALEIELMETL